MHFFVSRIVGDAIMNRNQTPAILLPLLLHIFRKKTCFSISSFLQWAGSWLEKEATSVAPPQPDGQWACDG